MKNILGMVVGLLLIIGGPLIWTSTFALHIFTVILAMDLVEPGAMRVIAGIAAFAFPVVSEVVMLVISFFISGDFINGYSKWVFAWITLLASIILPPILISKTIERR